MFGAFASRHGGGGVQRSAFFNGTTSLLLATDAGSPVDPIATYCNFAVSDAFTIRAWVRAQWSEFGAAAMTVHRRNPAAAEPYSTGWGFYVTTDGKVGAYFAGLITGVVSGAHSATSSAVLTDDTWHEVVCAYRPGESVGNKWLIRVDDDSKGITNIGDTIAGATTTFSAPMGMGGDTDKYQGYLRDVCVFNVSMSAGADATELYNGGEIIDPRTTALGAYLIGWPACGAPGDTPALVTNRAGDSLDYPNFAGTDIAFSTSLPGAP